MDIDEIGLFLERDSNYKKLMMFAMQFLPRELAEDAVQEALIKAIRHIETFDSQRASFKTWLYQIVQNSCTDVRRRETRSPLYHAEEVTELLEVKQLTPSPLDEVVMRERNNHLSDAIDKLTNLRKDAIKDFYYKGVKLSSKEGSMYEGTKTKTIRLRIAQGQHRLREILIGDSYGWEE